MSKRILLISAVFATMATSTAVWSATADEAAKGPDLRLVAKPSDSSVARHALSQPTVPGGAKEIAFIETAAEPIPTEAEKQRGFILFQRPTTEVIHPNTRPLPHERTESLAAFATPGQFEPLTFALYPMRPMEKLRVRVSPLTCSAGTISAECVDVRLATYWNIGYPGYTTVKTYRRVPELLERVTVHSSPAAECQRYWLTVHVPEGAKPGLYRGTATVWDDGSGRALEIPLALRVLNFKLQKDPGKHFSAYFYMRDRGTYKGRDDAFVRRALDNEYRAMMDFGFDMTPTLYLEYDHGKIVVRHAEEFERMLAAGLKGPVPATADNVIGQIYRETVPNGKMPSHHYALDRLPPPEFYQRITELFRNFEQDRKAKGWPEFVHCPIDEVDVSAKEFGVKVYAAVKAAGVRTYATHDPTSPDAADYAPYLDIWCSQPYSIPYERIVSQNRHEYWCYANHNACEIRDPQTMCKGGRMTYGFGLWRSGYTTEIPWHWSWTGPNPRDYLRGTFSGCGQRIDDEGEVIPAIYWACFRQGYDDERYLYTLQQAIVERERSQDRNCLAAVGEGRRILQETWDAINVQQKYLAGGMWPSEEFDAIRWRLAAQTSRLLAFPAVEQKTAPSVLVAAAGSKHVATSSSEAAAPKGKVEVLDLLADAPEWRNATAEGKLEVADTKQPGEKPGLRWTVLVDHKRDGDSGYPIGWPRFSRSFGPGKLDMTRFDTLQFQLRVNANGDANAPEGVPISLSLSSHNTKLPICETRLELPKGQQTWTLWRFSIQEMMAAEGVGPKALKSVSHIQLHVSESDFANGTRLTFDIKEASLLRAESPTVEAALAPRHVLVPRKPLAFEVRVAGAQDVTEGSHILTSSIEDDKGGIKAQSKQDLAHAQWTVMPMAKLEPGEYQLHLSIREAKGTSCSDWRQPITAHAGPCRDETAVRNPVASAATGE